MSQPIRLRAQDADDLAILSACLQDAILPIGEMCFLPDDRRFVLVVNRFKWEDCAGAEGNRGGAGNPDGAGGPTADDDHLFPYQRTHCGVQFSGIDAVRTRSIDIRNRHQLLELPSIVAVDDGLLLTFAGGGLVRLQGDHWSCLAEDIGEPWPTASRPCHPLESAAE
jgi:hypothetical protein